VILCGLVATLCVLSMGGCYQRVVRAKGLGADNYNVSEPYQESGKLDEWIFGTPGPSGKRANNTKLPPAQ
jgi:hypothetical protein